MLTWPLANLSKVCEHLETLKGSLLDIDAADLGGGIEIVQANTYISMAGTATDKVRHREATTQKCNHNSEAIRSGGL